MTLCISYNVVSPYKYSAYILLPLIRLHSGAVLPASIQKWSGVKWLSDDLGNESGLTISTYLGLSLQLAIINLPQMTQ